MKVPLWKFYCDENDSPGLWRLWFKAQCVAVSYSPAWARRGGRVRWKRTKKVISKIRPGHKVIAALPGRRVGKIGTVLSVEIEDDQWNPLVAPFADEEEGLFGRRVQVRWDLEHSPDDPDLVVQLPEYFGFNLYESRHAVARVTSHPSQRFEKIMADPSNWVGLLGRFGYERALSDYIALHPDRLEQGLRAQPNRKIQQKLLRVREKYFDDRTRSDVLLLDRKNQPVIVECKQAPPTTADVAQLRSYIRALKSEIGQQARGILVHGGARRIDRKVWRDASRSSRITIMQYKLDVDFAPSC